MPNYRKKNNKSKNKNLNQKKTTTTRTSSSTVKQEVSEFTSAGAEPNLPADVSFSRTSTTTIASTNVLEKDVVIVDDSLALSNEEIDANAACNVDIDTCSSDRKTVLTQSNCSPSSSECTFTSAATSTEIERNSARTISDGDSTFGNSAITDTFDAGTDINRIKTGSAHSKDAAVPIAATKSATRSVETTRKTDGNRTELEGILDEGETTKDFSSKVIVRKAFKKESSTTSSAREGDDDYEPVIIQQASKAIITGEAGITSGGSKVIVHKTFKSETKSSGRPGEDDHYETVIVQETPEGKTSKVIVHKYSKEGSPKPSVDVGKEVFPDSYPQKRVIVEESNTTTHTASKLSADQSPIVITQKSPKKKATRSTTSSLQSSSTKEVSKENVQENSNNVQDSPPTPESIKVIVHQISKEEQPQQSNSSTENLDQSSEVIGTPSETADRRSEIIQETRNEASSEKHSKQSSKVVLHQISTVNNPIGPTTQSEQSSKVIVHQITKEEVEQPTELETSLSKQQQPSSTVIVHQISTEEQQKTNVPRTSSTAQSEQSSKVIVHQISKEETQQPTELQTSLSKQQQPSSTVIVHQISAEDHQKTNVPPTSSTAQSEQTSRDIEQEISRKDTQKQTELQTSLSTRQQQSSKVIVHQISTEDHNKAPQITNLQKPAADFVPQKVSKVILHQISKEGLVQDCPPGHPTNKKVIQHEDRKQSAFVGEEQISKVIVHQISKEDSSLAVNINKATDIALQKSIEGPKTTDELTNKSSSTEDHQSKVIVHQISTEGSTTSQSTSSVEQTTQQNPTAVADQSPKVILHQFALDNSTQTTSSPLTTLPGGTTQNPLDEDLRQRRIFPSTPKEGSPSRVIVHPILQERSTQTELAEGKSAPAPPPRTAFPVSRSPKMIVHPIHQEGPPKSVFPFTPRSAKKLDQTSNEIAHEILKEASSELQSNLHQESVIRLAKEIPKGPVRTSFPVSTKGDGSIRPGFFEPAVVQPEVNPLDATDPKIIIRPILNEESIPVQNGFPMSSKHTSFPVSNRTDDLESVLEDLEMKVKLHQISLGKSNSTQSSTSSSTTSTSNGLQPKVIIHQILKEEPKTTETSFPISKKPNSLFSSSTSSTSMESASKNNDQTIVPESATKKSVDQQTSQDDSTSSLSSGESETTTILVKSPEPQSPSVLEDQQEKTITSEMSSSKEIIHKILQEVQEKREKSPPVVGKLIIHPILREIVQDSPQSYRVESPQPENRQLIVKKSKSFDDDDVVIQEMSDTSSAYDTDNPPVISEAESETDTMEAVDEYADTEINSRVLSVQTLPMDNEEENGTQMSPKTAQEYKVKRQQNRAALQSHFLPQYLSPIFLDSIKEENSDHSDTDRRSECSDRTDHAIQPDLDDDVFLEGGPHAKKADAVFPKSNLDFSKKHKHIHTNIRPPTTNAIREEASPPSMVEARIIDQVTVQEGCSSWSTDLTPECEAAEVVYIDSASSSVSDLLELDYSQGQADDSCDVRIQTPTIDLDSVNEMFAYRPASESDVPQPPVKDGENMSELTKTATDHVDTTTTLSSEKPTKTTQHQLPSEIILEKIETMSASTMANNNKDDDDVVSGVDGAQNSKEKISNSCDNAINPVVTKNGIPSVDVVGFIEKMENLRELVSASIKSELNTDSENVEKPNFKIGEPCSDYAFKCDTQTTTSSSSSSSSSSTTTTTTTTTSGTKILTLHDLSKTLDKTQHLHPLINSSSALDRQNSLDSHASDQSQSTNQSQCTAINQGSLPHTDWNEIDTSTDTTYVSETDTAGLASSENSSPNTTGRLTDDTESPPIRKLRSLCTETLASLPYGQEVLEELATVAQTIGEMPYPLPELPHIQDIQVSLGSTEQKNSSVIHLTQVPPRPVEVGQKMKSPPPPPVPAPPSKYDSWLGVPTESDPSVLVCLSPSQRGGVKDDSTPDSLLDMHKKFVERRGYHEYTTKQVDAMNKEKISETVKLSNSSLPPPLPPRQPQAPTQATKSNGDETETDENNHRLLAIIRDTHGGQQQQQHNHRQSSSENISRRTESGTTTTTTTTTNTDGGGGHEEFANSPSVSKQTQEQQFVGESNKSQSANHKMQKEQTDIKVDRESVLGLRFPTSEYFDSIFHDTNKRFSNIETKSSPNFCSQILSTQPKRYSNIETSTFESRKCVENGKVLYDVSDSSRQTVTEGEKDPKSFPEFQSSGNGFPVNSETATTKTSSNQSDSRTQITGDSEKIMSAFKLNTQTTAPSAIPPANRAETSPPAPPVPPLPTTIADTNAASMKSTSTTTSESVINRTSNSERKETVFDEFRQRAKEASAGTRNVFDHEKLFKDFDELSNLLKDELDSGKRRPPATLNGAEIPSAVRDYNRVAKESKTTTSSHTTTTESSRKEQMKMLADEIDRTSRERQMRKEMRIPIQIEKSTPAPPRSAPADVQQPRTYEIPVRVENGGRSLHQQRSYEIPVRVENQAGTRQRTYSEHHTSHEAPVKTERPTEQPSRFRRAESMFNVSDSSTQRHMHHDDWMKYVGDLGSSENICKPFQREVEICYLGRRPNIRAPRMSASTSDLSSNYSFDTHGAYDVRRTNNQTPRPQQPPPRRYQSTQSMIDTTPITSCVSSHRTPAPDRKRRSSLPREIHDQQMKYISSKEHQLQIEFERLENERRALIDEMNRAQINQRMNREAYRQRQLPPLTEDESFRQQMAEEWLNKVAEREERRLQKIIKISKINQDANIPVAPLRNVSTDDIGDEFLRRVKERRSKLHMPSDSDWESGAESQPIPRNDGSRSENEDIPVTILEGLSEASIRELPKHLREFAKLATQMKEERREETTENSSCSATKKSTIQTTVKTTSNSTNANLEKHDVSQSLSQQDARVRDLEQLSQGKRQKLVTILRQKKPTESSGCQPSVGTAGGETTTAGNSANSSKRRKQTRFLLTPNRLSWSESDLLREIDKELVLARGFLYANGVWTPKHQTPSSSRTNLNEFPPQNTASNCTTTTSDKTTTNRSSSACGRRIEQGVPTPPPPPLWTPQPERKQFRPVHFESPTLQRRYVRQQQSSSSAEVPPPPWSYTNLQPFAGYQSKSCTNLNQKNIAIPWPPSPQPVVSSPTEEQPTHNGIVIVDDPVVVEEGDDDSYVQTRSIADKIRSFERSNSNSELSRPFVRHNPHEKPATLRPNEVIYSVKNEYMSEPETEYEKPKKMAQLSRRQYDGIGPTTQHGMPVVLRSEVKEPNQHEWYKRIFQTIHKQKNPDDYVTIRYKCPRGRYPYKSNGYMSEPEPNYDSDYSTVKYRTLERRRLQSTGQPSENFKGPSTGAGAVPNDSQVDTVYGTMPNPVKSGQGSYKVQPGRIEDYITGHSSVSEKEKKEWWDEVMDIFNGWLKDHDKMSRVFIDFAYEVEQFQLDQQKLSPHYTEGNLSRALLKEQGYTSDSNLVFRKKDVPQHQSPLSPVEQKQVYRSVQSGGQPPLLGFRKPAPEKPKDSDDVPPIPPVPPTKGVPLDTNGFSNLESPNRYFESDVNIHYKTPIRYEYKDPIPEEELAIRQAESMQKLYQEERRRKYLQELQDMNSRRHTDNFTPTQKSPIPLNRYDDFNSDLAPKSPNSSSYPKTIARALYNFQGQTARELTFKKGDVIYIRRQIDKNWFEGEHNAMIGLLPSNYVELITKDGVRQPPKRPSEGQARAKYNFQAQSGIELSLNKGEHVTLTRRVDDNWYEGKIANRKGIFPVSYVEVLVDIGADDKMGRQQPASQSIIAQSSSSVRPSLDTLRTNINNEFNTITSNGQQPPNGILRETRTLHKTEVLHVDTNTEPVAYRALYKYRPQNTDELELQEGDIVYVLEKCDDGWFVGTSQRNGCFGTFPGNYVERV